MTQSATATPAVFSRRSHLVEHWSHQAMSPYRARNNRGFCGLDPRYWDALCNGDDTMSLMTSGCIDALDELPMGGASSGIGAKTEEPQHRSLAYLPMIWAERDWITAEERARREALVDQLIAEIRAEEAAERGGCAA